MNNSFFLQQTSRNGNLIYSNYLSRPYKLNLMADFMRMKYENPKLKQSAIANQLGYSSSILQRYRNDINTLSPYRINPNNANKRTKKTSNTNFDNNSHQNKDVVWLRLSLKQLQKNLLPKLNLLKVKTNWKVVQMLKLTINI